MKKQKKNPCLSCVDSKNGKREWGICGGGWGICPACMEWHEQNSFKYKIKNREVK